MFFVVICKGEFYDIGSECSILTSGVLPAADRQYDAWVYVHKELEYMLTAHGHA